jgi:RNA polymerase sigma-70 factor, ECF subfamily
MLQAGHPQTFSSQKFLNASPPGLVFMIEGKRAVAGEAILSGPVTVERSRTVSRDAVKDTRKNKDEVLETLVRGHSQLVYRIAYAVLRSHHDAEDATQETFLRVLRYRARLDGVEDPKTWLARIAWRVAVDRSQQRGRMREIALEDSDKPLAEPASPAAQADETVRGTQMGAVLEKLIAALPEKLREPLILSAIEEMSPREVGATLRINEAAVRSRVFRARHILREKLAQTLNRKQE